jgi:hypothetical protein
MGRGRVREKGERVPQLEGGCGWCEWSRGAPASGQWPQPHNRRDLDIALCAAQSPPSPWLSLQLGNPSFSDRYVQP